MKLMIVYGSTEGQTRRISEFLRDESEIAGHVPTLFDAMVTPPAPDPSEFDAVLIAASLHGGKYQVTVKDFVQKYHGNLNQMNSCFLSVSLTAATDEPESWKELKQHTEDFLLETGWKPKFIEQIAGALLYTQYDYFKRFIMRMISRRSGGDTDTTQDHEYTDWDQVRGVIRKIEKLP
ncbi:flavodoxin domain-containing protein [Rhodohalobacter sp.]|uniref:flavodoxin domain-containing protein n=1 Tax=Rhodohalobacter sp. TaxID=1974210 RepID=UPI002ACE3EAC|nr:flavodoxin domain-containing protein [Rhodohalobacter sp.]MDZ7757978.1 flavodoxin domain-containing protein [Rhodohalobacter sp.]